MVGFSWFNLPTVVSLLRRADNHTISAGAATQSSEGPVPAPSDTIDAVPQPTCVQLSRASTLCREALDDAERLLKYAAETGVDVDSANARSYFGGEGRQRAADWTEEIVANYWSAHRRFAARLRPISA